MTCPICKGALRPVFPVHGHTIVECMSCGHQAADLAPAEDHVPRVYADDYFFGGAAGYSDYLREGPLLRDRGRAYARLLARHAAPGTLLDVGAAAGFILEGFLASGWRGRGLEPNARMAALANERLGPVVETGTLEEWKREDVFDAVTMIQVVSHFHDLERALSCAARATREGGLWLIETWDRESVVARLFGRRWHEYSPPSVLHWFTPAGLADLAARFGFREIARGRPRRWIEVGHAASLLAYKLGSGTGGRLATGAARLLPSRLALPYPGDDLFWMILRREGPPGPP